MSSGQPAPLRESVRGVPAPALRCHVAAYQGYRQQGLAPALHRGLPSPYLTLIIALDEPLVLAAHPDPGQPPEQYAVLLGGLHETPALISHQGSQSGIQVSLRPLGARALLGLPAGELAGLDAHAADVLGPVAAELRERARAAASWPARFAVIDDLLTRQIRDCPPPPGVSRAWQLLLASRGQLPVPELAREAGWSSRRLQARFVTEIGLPPKAAARVVRFDRARRMLGHRVGGGGTADLAALAAACGYYDQAHLAREFRALAGCAPSRWVAEEFRNIQARAGVAVPDSRP